MERTDEGLGKRRWVLHSCSTMCYILGHDVLGTELLTTSLKLSTLWKPELCIPALVRGRWRTVGRSAREYARIG